MRVGVIDIGSNTARLLVADVGDDDAVVPVVERKAFLGLGAEIERRGTLRSRKVHEAARVASSFAELADSLGVERAGALVTAPGRHGDVAEHLLPALSAATRWNVRVLSAREEGRLAFDGAIARAPDALPEVVCVVDVGGGSTEIAVGTPSLGAAWVHSLELGSLRLTRRCLRDDPPTRVQVEEARTVVRAGLRELETPTPDVALAAGGSARAVGRALGRSFGTAELDGLIARFTGRRATRAARSLGIDGERATTVLAGAILLVECALLVGRPLQVANGGIREGAALTLAHEAAALAA